MGCVGSSAEPKADETAAPAPTAPRRSERAPPRDPGPLVPVTVVLISQELRSVRLGSLLRTSDLIAEIVERCELEVPAVALELWFAQAMAMDQDTLGSLGVMEGASLHLIEKEPVLVTVTFTSRQQKHKLDGVSVWRGETIAGMRSRLLHQLLPRVVQEQKTKQLKKIVVAGDSADDLTGMCEMTDLRARVVAIMYEELCKLPVIVESLGMKERLRDDHTVGQTGISNGDKLILKGGGGVHRV
eukprot:TRINITY_DN17076_c0_g1_i4.p1 TRINITY_DN17076_c0_g1~~TRINITY_DN17076_c0_g1_i4.p1  ORF type:complete len:243 (+),score=47.54 TRINITY_DN17076_c0_g1_i4:229-957(+)